jgi:hypothetical protein
MWVCLVVSIWPLIEVRTSLLLTLVDSRCLALTLTSPGAMGTMTTTRSYGRSRHVSPPAGSRGVGRWTVFMWVRLVVSIWPLIEVGTSLLLTLVDS